MVKQIPNLAQFVFVLTHLKPYPFSGPVLFAMARALCHRQSYWLPLPVRLFKASKSPNV